MSCNNWKIFDPYTIKNEIRKNEWENKIPQIQVW